MQEQITYPTNNDIYSTTIRITGVAYDSCLTTPTETTLKNGKTRKEYGLNVGLDEATAKVIDDAVEQAQMAQWSHVSEAIMSPVYHGTEIGIPEPYAITLGTIYKPEDAEEIPDGTPIEVTVNVRTYEGEKRHGVLTNLVRVREVRGDRRRFWKKCNLPENGEIVKDVVIPTARDDR